MKVCILTTSFPRWKDDMGGIFIASLTEKLRELDVEPQVVTPYHQGSSRHEQMYGAFVHRFQYWFPAGVQMLASNTGIPSDLRRPLAAIQLPFFLASYLIRAWRYAKFVDVIHANWIFSGVIGLILGSIHRKPVVITVHGSDAALARANRLLRVLAHFILTRAGKVIVVSRALRDEILGTGVPQEKVVIIPNGVDTEIFYHVPKTTCQQKILWVGRMSVEKNLPRLIDAFRHVVEQVPDATLTLIGEGHCRKEIEQMVSEYNLQPSVKFLGLLPHRTIANKMREADIFVLPSFSEGLALTVLEAMACGRPVVVSRVGAFPEIIDEGKNGFLVDPTDVHSLAKTLIDLLRCPARQLEVGSDAARSIEQLSWNAIARRTLAVYQQLL